MANEHGASICRTPQGKFIFGPMAEGTPVNVNVAIKCPTGSKFVGIWHSHPKGVPLPSQQDVRSGLRVGAKILCITVPETGVTKCHTPVRGRSR